jgi:Mn2+/Fe2+ NRAMP family transporter
MARDPRPRRDEAVRITTAAASRDADISARQRRYVVSMGIRTVCFVAAILVGDGWLRWVLVAAALLLPYVAVVMANAAGSRSDGFELLDGQYDRPELTAGTKSEDDTGREAL